VQKHLVLLIGRYTGSTTAIDTLKQVFLMNGIIAVTMCDVSEQEGQW
jgi:hypothetical protein